VRPDYLFGFFQIPWNYLFGFFQKQHNYFFGFFHFSGNYLFGFFQITTFAGKLKAVLHVLQKTYRPTLVPLGIKRKPQAATA
jgi:hypothetical protein